MPSQLLGTFQKNIKQKTAGMKNPWRIATILYTVILLNLFACAPRSESTPKPESTIGPTATETLPAAKYSGEGNLVFLSIEENGYAHLFAYHPPELPLTRITSGDWNDTSPPLSPDPAQLAFSSGSSGVWQL